MESGSALRRIFAAAGLRGAGLAQQGVWRTETSVAALGPWGWHSKALGAPKVLLQPALVSRVAGAIWGTKELVPSGVVKGKSPRDTRVNW